MGRRDPAAHRLATKKARAARRWVRQTRRNYRQRYVTGLSQDEASDDRFMSALRTMGTVVLPAQYRTGPALHPADYYRGRHG